MLNRVTNLTMSANAQRTLQTQQSRLAELQEKATTLNKISRPSDDPAATAKALETRSLLAANAQYARNIDDGNTWLTAADSALEQATNVMHRVKDLTVLAGNGSLPKSGKNAIANELDALNKELVAIANTKHLGRNIFAGNSDESEAFSGAMPPAFNGAGRQPSRTPLQCDPDCSCRRRRRDDLWQRHRLRLRRHQVGCRFAEGRNGPHAIATRQRGDAI